MSLSTRLTEKLQIRHPILLAPMDVVADARLAAAVSRAGGLGLIGGGYGDEVWLTRQLDDSAGERVGVGFITWSLAKTPHLLDLVLARGVPAVMLSFGDVSPFANKIRDAGVQLICQIQTLSQAQEALTHGADILVAQGAEAGGHGVSRATLPLVPAVVDIAGETPVVAAGGIADGRGLAAALMLGAEGALIGTRFYACAESAANPAAKDRVLAATGDRTLRGLIFDMARRNVWPPPYTGRVLCNRFSDAWLGKEDELLRRQDEISVEYLAARGKCDYDTAAVIAGEAVDLIHDIPSAGEIVDRIVAEASELLARAAKRYRIKG